MCFYRNINGNRDVKYLECDSLLVQRCVKLTLEKLKFVICHWMNWHQNYSKIKVKKSWWYVAYFWKKSKQISNEATRWQSKLVLQLLSFKQIHFFFQIVTDHTLQILGTFLSKAFTTVTKGQLISKQNCRAITSPKKQTKRAWIVSWVQFVCFLG